MIGKFTIGKLAKKADVNVETIRYYEGLEILHSRLNWNSMTKSVFYSSMIFFNRRRFLVKCMELFYGTFQVAFWLS